LRAILNCYLFCKPVSNSRISSPEIVTSFICIKLQKSIVVWSATDGDLVRVGCFIVIDVHVKVKRIAGTLRKYAVIA